jgi:hypothetical protein
MRAVLSILTALMTLNSSGLNPVLRHIALCAAVYGSSIFYFLGYPFEQHAHPPNVSQMIRLFPRDR